MILTLVSWFEEVGLVRMHVTFSRLCPTAEGGWLLLSSLNNQYLVLKKNKYHEPTVEGAAAVATCTTRKAWSLKALGWRC